MDPDADARQSADGSGQDEEDKEYFVGQLIKLFIVIFDSKPLRQYQHNGSTDSGAVGDENMHDGIEGKEHSMA
jgi:hypothetical protein